MCLVLIAYNTHPNYPLIIAANRDEYYQRPTRSACFWDDHPQILGGRDLKLGGTWMAIDRSGRMAAVTNYREPSEQKENLRSRGFLVTDYLLSNVHPYDYLLNLSGHVGEYDGFNVFAGDISSLYFYGSYLKLPLQMQPGIHGISNGDLDYHWPKVNKGKQALSEIIQNDNEVEPELLFEILHDREVPDDKQLPDTGMGIKLERLLAPIFVTGGNYGTRSSTVMIMDDGGRVYFAERSFDAEGKLLENVEYEFKTGET